MTNSAPTGFTVWRIHECNANFKQTFLADKPRLVFWLCAFLMIFWNKTGENSVPMLLAACGAFLTLVLSAATANRMFGRRVELLACWILLLFPPFLMAARTGGLVTAAFALTLLITCAGCAAKRFTPFATIAFGAVSALILMLTTLPAALIPVVSCIIMRTGKKTEEKPMHFLLTTFLYLVGAAAALVLAICFGKYALPPVYLIHTADSLSGIFLLALIPWFWCLIPALSAVNKALVADRAGDWKYLRLCNMLTLAVLAGVDAFGLLPFLPVMAIAAAWAFAGGFERYGCRWGAYLLRGFDPLITFAMPVICFVSPFWFIQSYADRAGEATQEMINLFYFRLPAAGILILLLSLIMHLSRRKKGPFFATAYPALDRLIPAVYGALLVVMP
ncbi:MAG: hypothetical protein J6T08_11405 [Lentisphaeria bacterium]|nr:hypothetical protein [Lentisphaeria bacterium]